MKRILRGALSLLFVLGVTIATWPLGQRAYGVWSQRSLESQWEQTKRAAGAHHPKKTTSQPHRAAAKHASQSAAAQGNAAAAISISRPATGNSARRAAVARELPPTRIAIPDIQLEAVVVSGLDDKALARGPGHDPQSALPGEPGNCVIAGHRNVYGSWFYRVDALWAGSLIRLETPDATHNYQVLTVQTVAESDYTVLRPPADPNAMRLTLITCTLPHSSNRIIVIAEKVPDEAL